MKKNLKSILAIVLALALSILGMTGCAAANSNENVAQLANGGTLYLKVNPEIAIMYDNDGLVTGVTARNDDALKLLANYTGFEGKETRTVVSELVTAIGEAGYFVEEVDGERRKITLEIEPGSALPSDKFLEDVVADVKAAVDGHDWQTPLNLEGITDYGYTNYVDTDYGPGNDGVTDYNDTDYGTGNDGVTDYDHNIDDGTDYGEASDGITDFDGTDYNNNTDYGVNADGNTDYNDSDYGVYGDGVTDYDHNVNDGTDYGEASDGITDFDGTDYDNNTDYGVNADGNTDYNDSDYGVYGDGVTDYIPATTKPASTKPSGGKTDYDETDYNAPAETKPAATKPTGGNTDYGDTNYDAETDYEAATDYSETDYNATDYHTGSGDKV